MEWVTSERKECDKCGSPNTYFTKKKKFCRRCGHETERKNKEAVLK